MKQYTLDTKVVFQTLQCEGSFIQVRDLTYEGQAEHRGAIGEGNQLVPVEKTNRLENLEQKRNRHEKLCESFMPKALGR